MTSVRVYSNIAFFIRGKFFYAFEKIKEPLPAFGASSGFYFSG
jgi:hypothetical protein